MLRVLLFPLVTKCEILVWDIHGNGAGAVGGAATMLCTADGSESMKDWRPRGKPERDTVGGLQIQL